MTAGVLRASRTPLRSLIVPAARVAPPVFTRIVNLLAE